MIVFHKCQNRKSLRHFFLDSQLYRDFERMGSIFIMVTQTEFFLKLFFKISYRIKKSINFALGNRLVSNDNLKIRSVLLLLVVENVGNFLQDASMAQRFSRFAWAAFTITSSTGFSYDHLLKCGNSVHAFLV